MRKLFKKYYTCRYCGRKFLNFAMSQICFDLDLKMLNHDGIDNKNNGSKNHNRNR